MPVKEDAPRVQVTTGTPASRKLPIGAEPLPSGGVHFRLWAPKRKAVEVVIEGGDAIALTPDGDGYFAGVAPRAKAGSLYRFRLDGEESLYPDPVSRFQPRGPHEPSQVVDPSAFNWTDEKWPGIGASGQVLYEMHVGTFTKEGTWAAAEKEVRRLAALGITCLEVMPVSEFAGKFGWGYDGVNLFAPTHLYGGPDDFRRFVDACHAAGMAVILDVVYNHIGPDGNYLPQFSDTFFASKHKTDWGEAINFDAEGNAGVREFFVSNARYWIEEYHLDGFRFDATQAILDDSKEHILVAVATAAREAAGGRKIYLVNENEPQHTRIVRPPDQGGYGMDALWNDDFHHSATVVLSCRNEAYYTDHLGNPQEFVSAAKWGYLFQGQHYSWQGKRRGTPALDLPPTAFVNFIQNHDQIANSARGLRAHQLSSPGQFKAMTAVLLLFPQTPMLFQGQEFASSSTFHYFADHGPALAKLVKAGRAKELSQYPSVATPEMQAMLLDPAAPDTFERSRIDHDERHRPFHAEIYEMHRDLLRLRKSEAVFRRVQRRGDIDGAVLGPHAFVLRYFSDEGDDRLLAVNFGVDLKLPVAPEPLLAPPSNLAWGLQWSSEAPRYGGSGTPSVVTEREGWLLPGRCAVVLRPLPAETAEVDTRVKKDGIAHDAEEKK